MAAVVNFRMNVLTIRIAASKANVWTLADQHCRDDSAIAIWDGLDRDVIRVSASFLLGGMEMADECCIFTESSIKATDIDYSLYNSKQLSPDYRIHWRILKEQKEIEVIMVVNGTTWVGLGWRPRQLTAKCKNFPIIREFGEPEALASVPVPEGEPKSEPASEPKSEPSSEPKSEPSSEPTSEPSSEPKSEPSSEPESEPTSEPKSEPTSEPRSEPGKIILCQQYSCVEAITQRCRSILLMNLRFQNQNIYLPKLSHATLSPNSKPSVTKMLSLYQQVFRPLSVRLKDVNDVPLEVSCHFDHDNRVFSIKIVNVQYFQKNSLKPQRQHQHQSQKQSQVCTGISMIQKFPRIIGFLNRV